MADGQHATDHLSRPKPALLLVGVISALVVIGVVLVLLTGGGDSPLIPGGHDAPPTPEFTFKVTKVVTITTSAGIDPKRAGAAAKPAATAAGAVLHDLYSDAFLSPSNWMQGEYDDAVSSAFASGARDEALRQLPILTAGADAGERFASIMPLTSTLRAKVLLNPEGAPYSVVGIVAFTANGINKDGAGRVAIKSNGQYFLEKIDSDWKVVSFSVTRHDEEKKLNASASPSGSSPTAEAS